MTCIKCNSDRIANIYAHSKDLGNFTYDKLDIDHDGYFPEIQGICDGDDADIEFCLECGQIQANFPITDKQIKLAVSFDEDDEYFEQDRPVYKIQLLTGEALTINNPMELFNHPYVKEIKTLPNFKQFITTIDPFKGRTLVAAFLIDDNINFKPIAYVPMEYLSDYLEINWREYCDMVIV